MRLLRRRRWQAGDVSTPGSPQPPSCKAGARAVRPSGRANRPRCPHLAEGAGAVQRRRAGVHRAGGNLPPPDAHHGPAGSAAAFRPGDGAGLKVITMDTAFRRDARRGMLERMLPNDAATTARCKLSFVSGGAGLPGLPRSLGDATPGLVALTPDDPPPGRNTFIGYHRDLRPQVGMRELLGLIVEKLANSSRIAASRYGGRRRGTTAGNIPAGAVTRLRPCRRRHPAPRTPPSTPARRIARSRRGAPPGPG